MRGFLVGRRAASATHFFAFGQSRWVSTTRVTCGMNLIEKIVLKHTGMSFLCHLSVISVHAARQRQRPHAARI